MTIYENITEALTHCAAVARRSSTKLPAERSTVPAPPPDDIDDDAPTQRMRRTELEILTQCAGHR